MLLRRLPWLLAVLATSCAAYEEPTCQIGSDCASGICNRDGTCAPESTGSGTSSSTTSSGTGGAACMPNTDGVIARVEVGLQAGLHATFEVGDSAMYDTAGKTNADGSRTWDLKVPFSGDHPLVL